MGEKHLSSQDSDLPAGLSQPALRALYGAGYLRLEQLAEAREGEISQLHGIGPHALNLLRRLRAEKGLSFKEDHV